MPNGRDAEVLQVLCRKVRQDTLGSDGDEVPKGLAAALLPASG